MFCDVDLHLFTLKPPMMNGRPMDKNTVLAPIVLESETGTYSMRSYMRIFSSKDKLRKNYGFHKLKVNFVYFLNLVLYLSNYLFVECELVIPPVINGFTLAKDG